MPNAVMVNDLNLLIISLKGLILRMHPPDYDYVNGTQ